MTEQGEIQRQSIANITNPCKTVWVSANAGSGKTYVLSRRVIRLMLEGAKPAELLCLTFTKAAAAEMENRVFEILGEWVMLEASELKKALRGLTGKKPGDAMLERARRLFAIALDTPGGLRIQTIHAFCESLLHQFTLEANVPGYFELMDDAEQASLIAEARQVVLGGMASLDDAILDHLDNIRDGASEDALQQGVTELINKRELLREFLGEHPETAIARIFEALAVDPNDTENQLFDRFRAETGYSPDDRALLDAELHAKDGKAAKKILTDLEMLDRAQDPIAQHFLRRKIFLKANNEPRASLVSASFIERPGLYEPFFREQALLCAHIDQVKALKAASLTRSLLLVVLIDEAQDTSPLQWRVDEAITSEFYAGEGAQKTIRTVFVVGDQKQSIFSFQGADPEEFNRQYRQLKSKVSQAGLEYDQIPLQVSWRSTQEILSAVDQVFSLTENARGLGRTDETISHTAYRKTPGEVIIWPLIRQPDKPKKTDWLQPPDVIADNSAEEQLAAKIASEIEKWIQNGEKLPGADRPIRHGDILILVRKRV
ncbi:MAG: UvrD-helicase domain-containing protein [Methyloceanibacter sp.]